MHCAVKRNQQGYRTGNFLMASELAYISQTCLTVDLQKNMKHGNVKVFEMLLGSGMMILIKISVAMAMEEGAASAELWGGGAC